MLLDTLLWLLESIYNLRWLSLGIAFVVVISTYLFWAYDEYRSPSTFTTPEACSRIGLDATSHLADEFDHEAPSQEAANTNGDWRVKSLWSYPVKSCRGVEFDQNIVTSLGMKYDRTFTFAVDTKRWFFQKATWKFVTQRQIPALATIRTEIWAPDPKSPSYSPRHPNVISDGVIVLRWPRISKVEDAWYAPWRKCRAGPEMFATFPYNPTVDQIKSKCYKKKRIMIWKDQPEALLVASTNTGWGEHSWMKSLRAYLKYESETQHPSYKTPKGLQMPGWSYKFIDSPFALFRLSNEQPRQVYRNAPTMEEAGYQPITGFQDAYPLQLLGIASVRRLAGEVGETYPTLSAKNFRSNIIVAGGEAHAEDHWKLVNIGGSKYYVTSRTTRCPLPNVDQDTGRKHPQEPLKIMTKLRRIDEGIKSKACLGMHVVPGFEEETEIKVGDTIEVLELGDHRYITWEESERMRKNVATPALSSRSE